jgi:Lrp/AsnC family leucine-responsive transcriptional regulator
LRALERKGVIRQYAAVLDPQLVGLGLLAYVTVKLEKRGKMPVEQFKRAVESWPEVIACYAMTGDTDYLMRVQVEDLGHYSRFIMDTLLKQPGVIDIRSNFVLERVKETTVLPLEHLG